MQKQGVLGVARDTCCARRRLGEVALALARCTDRRALGTPPCLIVRRTEKARFQRGRGQIWG